MAEYNTITYLAEGPLGIISLDRPDKLNAINGEMVSELNTALSIAEEDESIRVVVLRGEGRAFSAGFDLDAGAEEGVDNVAFWREELKRDFDIIMRFWDSPKPTIAAVHGYCLGSAMEMAVACDITIASSDTRLGAPEVKFGSGIVALVLPWLIGVKAAKEFLLSGDDRICAERALSIGLVNRVVEATQLDEQTRELALGIAANDQLAVRLTKQAINRSCEIMGMREAMLEALEVDVQIETTQTPESSEFNRILAEQGTRAALAWRRKNIDGKS